MFVIRGSQIVLAREYNDSRYAASVFGGLSGG